MLFFGSTTYIIDIDHIFIMKSIRHLSNADISYEDWNACIYNASNGRIYAYSWYLDIFAPNWEALVYGDYSIVMPLPNRKKWALLPYLFQPFFSQQLGIFSPILLKEHQVYEFLKAIPSKYKWIDIYLNEGNYFEDLMINPKITSRTNYVLDLMAPYEQLRQAYSKNTIRNLKRGQAFHLRVEQVESIDTVVTLFQQQMGSKVPAIKQPQYQQLKELLDLTVNNYMGEVYHVYTKEGELCAALALVKSHERLVYLLPVSTGIGKKQRAMFVLIDYLIQKNAGEYLSFDFEGSMIEGIARFFKGFGAIAMPYLHYKGWRWGMR